MTTQSLTDRESASQLGRFQVAGFLTMSALAILLSLIIQSPIPFATGMAVAVVSVALLGIPHGALDLMHLRYLATRLGRAEILWIGLAVYVLLGCLVIVAWVAFPAAMLTAFLIATVLHWGSEDAQAPRAWDLGYVSEVLLRGAIPIMLPSVFHAAETTWLFSQLIPTDEARALTQVIGVAWPALLVLAIPLLARPPIRAGSRPHGQGTTLIELATVAALFAVTPPLVAFAVYFGLLHSARFLARYAADRHSARQGGAVKALVRDALPMTLLTWVLALAAFVLLSPERTGAQLTLQVVFIGLAALTFPHALLMMSLRFVESGDSDGLAKTDAARDGAARESGGFRRKQTAEE